jgi:hypothetical protein
MFKKKFCSTSIKIFKAVKVFRGEDRAHLDLTIEKRLNTYMELLREKSIKLNLK